jgi:hypothetical protein
MGVELWTHKSKLLDRWIAIFHIVSDRRNRERKLNFIRDIMLSEYYFLRLLGWVSFINSSFCSKTRESVGVELKTKGDGENKDKITFLESSLSCKTFNLVTSTFHWHLNNIEQNDRITFNFVRCCVST